MRRDYVESGRDPFVEMRKNVFKRYYAVKELKPRPTENYFVFIDSGFKRYTVDVASITVMHVGSCVRGPDGGLVTLKELIGEVPIDSYIVYTSRRRVRDRFEFDVKVMGLSNDNVLVKYVDSVKASGLVFNKINEFVSFSSRARLYSKKPRFFVRLSKYITDLIELAYGLKVALMLEKKLGLKPVIVLDGTLIKWFGIERIGGSVVDGLDIVIELLKSSSENPDPSVIDELLGRTVGLAKTSKFTTLARCFELFDLYSNADGLGLYTNVDAEGAVFVQNTLDGLLKQNGLKEFVDETIKIFNRVVFDRNGYCVARFPLTSDGRSVFMVDLYVKSLVLGVNDLNVVFNYEAAVEVNERLDRYVPELFSKRSALIGHPPLGYMEVDQAVRLPTDITKRFEELFESYLVNKGERSLQPLIQAFQQSFKMRYGYK